MEFAYTYIYIYMMKIKYECDKILLNSHVINTEVARKSF